MSIVGIGIDLVKISRLEGITKRWGNRFLDRVFTKTERAYCLQHKHPEYHFSARFAVKEATMKALGTGLQNGICWKEVETRNDSNGKPEVRVSGKTRQLAEAKKVSGIFASIAHDHDYAIGQIILEQIENNEDSHRK